MAGAGGFLVSASALFVPLLVEQIALGQVNSDVLSILSLALITVNRLSEGMFLISKLAAIAGYKTILTANICPLLSLFFRPAQAEEPLQVTQESRASPVYQTEDPTVVPRQQNYVATAVLLAFVAVAFWYVAVVPAGEGVDEIPHYQYVLYVKEQK
ncbi:MAG: hypothetical protein JSW55_07660, partial [Chloroflexota bacterium]